MLEYPAVIVANIQVVNPYGETVTVQIGLSDSDARQILGNFTYAPVYDYLIRTFGLTHGMTVLNVHMDVEDTLRVIRDIATQNYADYIEGQVTTYAKR